ncbi:hypothetical protein C1646_819375 [Rhizophagus diaphanus]|nr:hypothetical protein C1646_819375 [Rhizophagus diaphanus] [Rhizophagus sp. MUCL 43196]
MSKDMIYDITNSQPPTGNTEYSSSILSTVPKRNAVIIPGANQITITYKINDIKPSIGYITISQKNTIEGGDDFLRTKISANNSKSITIIGSEVRVTLEDYVFDRGSTTYIIKIDDDFVEVNGQNLTGSSWEVSTAPGSGSNEPGDTRATILLTSAGTKNYLKNRNIFVYEMSKEISKALAIEEGRIFIPYDRYQYKRNTHEDQVLLRIDIKDNKTPDQPRTRTADLDPNYGAPENLHLWRKYRYILIGVIIELFFLLIIWIFARRIYSRGRNFSTIIFYPLILNASNDSRRWRKRHSGVALIFMLLSWLDLEALNVITSRCANIGALNARFTEETQKRIDNSIVTIVFIEDVSQLIFTHYIKDIQDVIRAKKRLSDKEDKEAGEGTFDSHTSEQS